MLKISRIRLCEYNKSCSTLHNESNKIEFALFLIFNDFLCNLQVSAICKYYWRYSFALRPLERNRGSQCGPWPSGRRGSGQCRRTGGAPVRGRSGERRGAHWGSICGRRQGGKAPGGGSWRWPAVPATGASAPVEGRRRQCIQSARGGGVGSCEVARALGWWW
jgi:hypothetical protein